MKRRRKKGEEERGENNIQYNVYFFARSKITALLVWIKEFLFKNDVSSILNINHKSKSITLQVISMTLGGKS